MKKLHAGFISFLYLLSTITLVLSIIGILEILFFFIEKFIPDPLKDFEPWRYNSIKFAFASLVIATPIYITLNNFIDKYIKKQLINFDSSIRKWFHSLIILVTSITIITVLINLIISFLNGELSLQIFAKITLGLIIAILVLLYYSFALKESLKVNLMKIFNIVSISLFIIAFISSFFVLESPQHARYRRVDEQTLEKINSIHANIDNYYYKYKKLPENLDIVKQHDKSYFYFQNLNSINEKHPITYKILNDHTFEICADFYLSSKEIKKYSNYNYLLREYNFPNGHYCFEFSVKKYPETDPLLETDFVPAPEPEIIEK